MRPKITCHMITSLDGRLDPDRWTDPADGRVSELIEEHYEDTAERLGGDGWIVGRRSILDHLDQDTTPDLRETPEARPAHWADPGDRGIAVVIDPRGRLRHTRNDIDGDHVVTLLSERVTDDCLARLRRAGVSYVFAGPDGDRLGPAMAEIGEALGSSHLILEGGGMTNGAFLAAGLIDATSTLICPAIDGLSGVPAIYEHAGPPDSLPCEGQHLRLLSCDTLAGGVVWLRHEIVRADRADTGV